MEGAMQGSLKLTLKTLTRMMPNSDPQTLKLLGIQDCFGRLWTEMIAQFSLVLRMKQILNPPNLNRKPTSASPL